MIMLKVLINAYACSPYMGSEPGMAWNWCVHLANYCELHIITEGEFRDKIETVVPTLPQGKNMHFYYNPVTEDIRHMCWNQGDWRFYEYYRDWQWKTYLIAKDICVKQRIDVLHQLNMIGFREPGYLWKIEDVPIVWGPVDAKEMFPVEYLDGASLKSRMFMLLKNLITKMQLRHSERVRKMVNKAAIIVSASSNSQRTFKKYFGIDTPIINETGCYVKEHCCVKKFHKDTFDLLWVGKMDFRKQLMLAIRTIAKVYHSDLRLHIVGGGDVSTYQEEAETLKVKDLCVWHGSMTHEDVQRIMQEADLLFFTSVAEGTPHVVLEAIGNCLPILCFDTCGQGDSVNEVVGIKIPITNPHQSVKDFAEKIEYLYWHRELLQQLSEGCTVRQKELSWERKAQKLVDIYMSLR